MVSDIDFDEPLTVEEIVEELDVPDTWYPVVLESTERRVVWVEAESQQQAYRYLRDEPWELWEGADPVDDGSSLVAIAPTKQSDEPWYSTYDEHAYTSARELEVGPTEACPECGATARERDHHAWRWGINHAGTCSRHSHYVSDGTAYVRDANGRERMAMPLLRFPKCSCGEPGWDAPYRAVIGEVDFPALSKEAYAQLAQQHVAGRPHSKNIPLGLTGLRPADRSYSRLVTE